jgi:hypothetical protein
MLEHALECHAGARKRTVPQDGFVKMAYFLPLQS